MNPLPKTKLLVFVLGGFVFLFFWVLTTSSAYLLGRYLGFREGFQQALSVKMGTTTTDSSGIRKELERKGNSGAQKMVLMPEPLTESTELPLANPDGSLPSLSQLEGTLKKILPSTSGQAPKPSSEALALVKKSSQDSNEALGKYLQEVHVMFETSLSGPDLLTGMQGGDPKALQAALAQMRNQYEKLKSMHVPPRGATLHAYYLTLVGEIMQLFEQSAKVQGDDVAGLMENLGQAQKILALQKQVSTLEGQLAQEIGK